MYLSRIARAKWKRIDTTTYFSVYVAVNVKTSLRQEFSRTYAMASVKHRKEEHTHTNKIGGKCNPHNLNSYIKIDLVHHTHMLDLKADLHCTR